jgi:deoxyribose-phosphate aldolase
MQEDAAIAARALACLDLTELDDAAGQKEAEELCGRAVTPHGDVAAVCVWPRHVALCRLLLGRSRVRVATVVNFPAGCDKADEPARQTRAAVDDGADEIDVVLPYRAFMEGRADAAARVLDGVRRATGGGVMKVILETGMLRQPAAIRRAADLAIDEGADFIKTSTGKTDVGATADAVIAMLSAIRISGRPVGLKVSGGVRTLNDARTYIELADAAMGEGWAKPETFRIGASGLLSALMLTLEGREADAPAASGY